MKLNCLSITAILTFLMMSFSVAAGPVEEGSGNIYQDLQVLKQALFIIHSNYQDEIDSSEMIHNILEDYTDRLDKHSQFIEPKNRENFDIAITGKYGGIGAYISLNENDRVIIETPMDDSPSKKAGLKPNDVILEIEGVSTEGMKLDEAASKLKGIAGTKVVVLVGRGEQDPFKVTITREVIKLPSAREEYFEDYGIAYLRLGAFVENTPEEVREKLTKLMENDSVNELIIDLRYNGGGILSTAVDLAGFFLPRGSTVVSTKGRLPATWKKYITRSEPLFPDIPLIILINEGSASASEILAGAIRDHKRGVLMGTRSFGKGSVQEIFPLQDGAELKLTVAHYYTPSGEDIHKKGIEPDISIEMPAPPEEKNSKENGDNVDKNKSSNENSSDVKSEGEAEKSVKKNSEDDDEKDAEKEEEKNDKPLTKEEKSREWKENLDKYDPQLKKILNIIRSNRILYRGSTK